MHTAPTDAPLLLPLPSGVERPVPAPQAHKATLRRALFAAVLALALALAQPVGVAAAPRGARVHPSVHRALQERGTADLIVTLASPMAPALESVRTMDFTSRGAKIDALRERLETHSATAAADVERVLQHERRDGTDVLPVHGGYKRFWISNQVLVSAAPLALVEQLAALDAVSAIREQAVVQLDKPPRFNVSLAPAAHSRYRSEPTVEWGVSVIGAPQVWAHGVTGEGVVVANIDGGVRATHEALAHNFRGAYGWFDPEKHALEPYDVGGHGTHTMGTMAGANGIGVAPGATWMACKGCRADECTDADLLECAQWILCPTDPRGKLRDCSKAPHVVSNSWSSPGGDDWFQAAVDAWVAAGIIPVFSQSNTGPACSTVGSPGDYLNVIAVGASTPDDGLAKFSARGPSAFGATKPDITAPGSAVRSAYGTDDAAYAVSYGTSMATPHVAGAIALVLSAQPGLSAADVKAALLRTAVTKTLAPSDSLCGGTTDRTWPNNQYGSGRVNVLDAYSSFAPQPWIGQKAPTH